MTLRRLAGLVTLIALAGCGETYIDADATTPPTDQPAATSPAPVDLSADTDVLLEEMATLMRHLDEQIIDDESPDSTVAAIERIWVEVEPRLDGPGAYQVGQTVELAHSGVDRNRPADASKGYKLLNDILKER